MPFPPRPVPPPPAGPPACGSAPVEPRLPSRHPLAPVRCTRVGSLAPQELPRGGGAGRVAPRGSTCRRSGLAVTLCSRRERQEQLMGYRKRGPKPKPLVVQVNARWSPAPHLPGSLFAARPRPQGAAFSGFHHAEEPCARSGCFATPRGPPGPSAELIGRSQPPPSLSGLRGRPAAPAAEQH